MYKLTRADGSAAYSETCVYIYLDTENGCYVETTPENAGGVCIKEPTTIITPRDDGSGESDTITTVADTVYRIGDGLAGTEPVYQTIETVPASEAINAAIDDVLTELEALTNE